jgi:hypothetical protein
VNDFVEECRREWKRLGVPDSVANDMAAELEADLGEADAEGASAEEVLGTGAFDARAFANAWAAERGVGRLPLPTAPDRPRRLLVAATIAAFAVLSVAGAALVILDSPTAPRRLTLASPTVPPGVTAVVSPDGFSRIAVAPRVLSVRAGGEPPVVAENRYVIGPSPATPSARTVSVDLDDSGLDARILGSVLLSVGLAGVLSSTMFWLWLGPGRRSRSRAHVDDGPGAPAY